MASIFHYHCCRRLNFSVSHAQTLRHRSAHLPKKIADMAFDRIGETVPDQYVRNAIASCLASKMVYKEGTKFIESQPKDRLAANALLYLEKEKEVAKLMESLADVKMPEAEKEQIIKLLDAGGARTSLNIY